ncbi:MarR family winged helix-turn-helix transcriptional regulator [Streptococcus cristatus]|uniref:Sugar-specific transcriptional regulator, TrmB family n=1 Tax=Streptococcus cristatus ATCC 51100 TaxID=889201 RepID=A0AAV3ED03_STRCR|nr:MarR family transcriptional regulator [Streptococcus cristatus]EGU66701.1 sugar-specific transcriptional regulator, TrmB family [Streptococcus cristatus ATCC 51100]KJQ57479.1 MarR family transcriptional regulator [Streptococcus cristatus]SQG31851.1 transcriptional regulator [Streptococcus cristatus ATCC 51100]
MDYRQLFRQMGFISRQAMMKMNQEASQYGLDNNLFLILTRIVEHPAIHQSQLAELVQIDKTTLSRSLRKLEERGLIIKKTKQENKKFKELYPLTPALKVYDKLIGYEDRYIQASLHHLTSSELFQLDHILQKIQNSQQEEA